MFFGVFMSQKFEDLMCSYILGQTDVLKNYLLAAFKSQAGFLCYIAVNLGTPVPSVDLRNCELLTDAGFLHEETNFTRDGRNQYKVFSLTAVGRHVAKQIEENSYNDKLSESLSIAPQK